MGMDVEGTSPSSDRGEFFRNSAWWWRPLWRYCEEIAPDLIPADNAGQHNDGWGLNKEASQALADRLAEALASGEAQKYEKDYAAYLETLPPEPCTTCGGTGNRAIPPNTGPGPQPCNACQGKGKVPNPETYYRFSVENVRNFEVFLRDCGGFQIW